MHAQLIRSGMVLMGSDMIGPGGFKPGNTMALALQCSTEDDIKHYFSGLSEGGQVLHPLMQQPWASLFGVLVDKYGVAWMLNYQQAA
jgi:PhnB protein